jgi:hypothetical protein
MAAVTVLALSFGMMVFLGQFQEIPAADWVKLAEATNAQFKLEKVAVRVTLVGSPTAMHINYLTKADSKFNTAAQNAEMERVAGFAVRTYGGKDLYLIEQINVTRSEVHGGGCFQQTYVANFSMANPRRTPPPSRGVGMPIPPIPPRSP